MLCGAWGGRILLSVLMSLAVVSGVHAQDGHIDPSSRAHHHALTFARHAATSGITASTIRSGLALATVDLQRCDSRVSGEQDVATGVSVAMTGALGTFGAASDGLDVITTSAELNAVFAEGAAYAKVVTAIEYCGGPTVAAVGCAPTPGASLVVVAGLDPDPLGEVIVHELGHNKGLTHRDAPGRPLMHTSALGMTEVNQDEAAAFHQGGDDVGPHRPVDVAFVVDDTGSMGEEIDGVRSSLSRHLSTYGADACLAFEMTTFKDVSLTRAATTDLSVIGSQVDALQASGGGDCPEASVDAVNAAAPRLKDGGRALIATDASPTPGSDLAGAISNLRARGVRVDVLLTGDCETSSGLEPAPFAANDGADAVRDPGAAGATLDAASAVEAFSLLASETGGVFAFVPEVNRSGGSGVERFENVSYNVIQGGRTPSLALASPSEGPAGATLTVTFTGSRTSFSGQTDLQIDAPGVRVLDVTATAPTELVATVAVGADVAPGFRDVTATTDLGDGQTETAVGRGAFEVTPTATRPTILSVTPSTVRQGERATVTVLATGTAFDDESDLRLGGGVAVVDARVTSPTRIEADVEVDPAAPVGFRDVGVWTGFDFAGERVTGPFFVSSAQAAQIPRIATVVPAEGGTGRTVSLTIAGENTTFQDGVSTVSFSGSGIAVLSTAVTSPTRLTATVRVERGVPLGVRDVRVATGEEVVTILDGFSVVPGGPVVELAGIDVDAREGEATLSWTTAREANGVAFAVDRRLDGAAYQPVGAVDGRGGESQTYTFTDRGLPFTAQTLQYRLRVTDADGTDAVLDSVSAEIALPDRVELRAPFPSPLVDGTTLRYVLPEAAPVTIRLYDVLGRRVATLADGPETAGRKTAPLDASRLAPGTYFVRLTAGDEVRTRKVAVVR